MKLFPFSKAEASEIALLLYKCRNYAPETSNEDDTDDIGQYFRDAFVLSMDGGQAYIVKESHRGICAFVTIDCRTNRNGFDSRYITGLYIQDGPDADVIAEKTIHLIRSYCDRNIKLYVNVHPENAIAVAFWEAKGYKYEPDASDFTNYYNERLRSYEKSQVEQ